MSFVNVPERLLDLSNQALVLTYSQRMAMHTLQAIAEHHKKSKKVWPTRQVHALAHWLKTTWLHNKANTEYAGHVLLSGYQEQLLWKKVLSESSCSDTLVNYTQTAHQVAAAYRMVDAYCLDISVFEDDNHPDPRAYSEVHSQFTKYCREKNWVISTDLLRIVTQWIDSGAIQLPDTIEMAGFDEITPRLKLLLNSLESCGVFVNIDSWDRCQGNVSVTQYANQSIELAEVSNLVVDYLSENPKQKVAVVAPKMEQFNQQLYAQLLKSGKNLDGMSVKDSIGMSLTSLPLVSVAIKLISLPHASRSLDEWLTILLSSHAFPEELEQKHILADLLEQQGREEFSIQDVVGITNSYKQRKQLSNFCDGFLKAISSKIVNGHSESLEPGKWVTIWLEELKSYGWCSNLDEAQPEAVNIYNRFIDALAEFSGLSLIEEEVTRYQCLKHLRSYLAQQVYHAPVNNPDVYLLSAPDAAHLSFDKVYFIGANASAWPQSPRPNPFIPVHSQKEALIPHSSAERELHYSKLITHRLHHISPSLEVSYSVFTENEETVLSRLFDNNSDQVNEAEAQSNKPLEVLPVAWLEDSYTYELPAEKRALGGASALKDFSSCPFKAYAKHRLGIKDYRKPVSGLSASERGNLVHRALELVWMNIKDSSQLTSLKQSELSKLVHKATEQAFEEENKYRKSLEGTRFKAIEIVRVVSLVINWLDIEKQRPGFKVRATEQQLTVRSGPLSLSLKLDRLDELENGELVVLDYKTGACKPQDWVGQRMRDPQMPLYATNLEPVSAVSFISLQPTGHKFLGVTSQDNMLPGVKRLGANSRLDLPDSWDSLMETWKQSLSVLSEGFVAGNAEVNPLNPTDSCRYCSLSSVCRINDNQPQE